MRETWTVVLLTLLILPARPASGQRLPHPFGPIHAPELAVPQGRLLLGLGTSQRPRECGARPFLVAAGALGGALGGYIGYEMLWGIWPGDPSGFWGRPFRTTLMVGGAVFGAIGSAVQLSRACNTRRWAGA